MRRWWARVRGERSERRLGFGVIDLSSRREARVRKVVRFRIRVTDRVELMG